MHEFSIWHSHEIPSLRYAISICRVIRIQSIDKLKYISYDPAYVNTILLAATYEYDEIDMMIEKTIFPMY